QRVLDAHREGGDPQLLELLAGHERWIPRLRKTRTGEDIADLVQKAILAGRGWRPARAAHPWQRRRHAGVAVDATPLLDEGFGDADVEAKDRWQDIPQAIGAHLDVEVEAFEDRLRLLERHVSAEHVVDQARAHVDAHWLLRPGIDVCPVAVNLSARELDDERC